MSRASSDIGDYGDRRDGLQEDLLGAGDGRRSEDDRPRPARASFSVTDSHDVDDRRKQMRVYKYEIFESIPFAKF